MNSNIGILGAGSFGTALAHVLSEKNRVTLWGRNRTVLEGIHVQKRNPDYLNEILLNPFQVTASLEEACYQKDILIIAVPAQFLPATLKAAKGFIHEKTLLVNTAKGIEKNTLMTPSALFADVLGPKIKSRYAMLSGPTFAIELARKNPTGATIASVHRKTAQNLQKNLSLEFFRLYTSTDVLGVELGGSLKNVMAIGTGIAEGLGFGLNTRAGLMTRCLHEMTKLGVKMGAKALTFLGLSGVGDLILTCTGALSRNRFVGLELGRGKNLSGILSGMKSVAEGIETSVSVYHLAKKQGVEMPNAEFVYRILHEGLNPKKALHEILGRTLKEETAGLY